MSSVVAFPLHRRQTLLNGIVQVLQSTHGEDANTAWRQTAKKLLGELAQSGVALETAEDEVRSLLHAALAQIRKDAAVVSG